MLSEAKHRRIFPRREFQRLFALLGVSLLTGVVSLRAQTPASPQPATQKPAPSAPTPHRFWDSPNLTLFAGVVAVRTLDYTSTQHFRARGVNEWLLTNSIVDNKPLFVGLEVAGAAASVGVAYWLHRKGRHRLERWISVIHIGVGLGGSIRNYTLHGNTPGTSP
ncbi:MAG: hypothetical protein LAP13_04350 [Acidobacteriia bacterium]|nr:hypothetical protein [Terriglobia bacterium]